MNCIYKVKYKEFINGKLQEKIKDIDSEAVLDKWVLDNYYKNPKNLDYFKKLKEKLKSKSILFDEEALNAQALALSTLDQITDELSKRSDKSVKTSTKNLRMIYDETTGEYDFAPDEIEKFKGLIGLTKYINQVGHHENISKPMATASNQDDYEEVLKTKIEKDIRANEYANWLNNNGNTEQSRAQFETYIKVKQEEAVKEYRLKRKIGQLLGDDIHSIMEVFALNKMGKTTTLKPGKIMTKQDQEDNKEELKKIFDDLIKRYKFSDEAQFFPEFTVFGKNIDSISKRVLKNKTGKDYDGILARIDLLVVDKGKAYVFDFKTTAGKQVWDWTTMDNNILRDYDAWPSAKKVEAMNQIAMELAILSEWGLEYGGGEVIPITVSYNEDSNGHITGIKTKEITQDGRTIEIADSSNGHKNIKGLKLDTSLDQWNDENDPEGKHRKTCAERIRDTYYPRAKRNISIIKPLNVKEWQEEEDEYEYMFPSKNGESNKEFQSTVNFFLVKYENGNKIGESHLVELASDDRRRLQGYSYMMYIDPRIDLGYGKGAPILFKTSSDEETIPKIQEYCDALNKSRHDEFIVFAQQLGNLMQIKGKDGSEIEDAVTQLIGSDPKKKEYLAMMLRKYMTGDWKLYGAGDMDNKLVQRGIFIFYKNDVIEVVVLSHEHLHYEVNYGTKRVPKKSILNGLTQEKQDQWAFLSSSKGNMLLMKALNIISKDPEIYRNGAAKIQKIMAINPWMRTSSFADNDMLLRSWNGLVALSSNRLKGFSKNNFVSSVDAALDEAEDILRQSSVYSYVSTIFDNQLKDEEDIIKIIERIKRQTKGDAFNDDGTPRIDTTTGYGIWCLLNAMLLKRNLRAPIEHDSGKILEGGIFPVGLEVNSPGNSASTTVRNLDVLTGSFKLAYDSMYHESSEWLRKHLKTIYDECGYNPNTQSRKNFWKMFFRQDGDVVAKQMKIRQFSDSFWNDYPKSKAAFKEILDQLAKYKGFKLSHSIKTYEQYDPDKYYEMPLSKGTTGDLLKRSTKENGIGKGIVEFAKTKWDQFKKKAEMFYFGDESVYTISEEDEDLLQSLTNKYCNYTAEQRTTWCNSKNAYSTDIEEIMNKVLVAQAISEISKTYGFLYAGMKTALAINEKMGGEKVPELSDYVSDYITKIYKGRSIMDGSLRGLAEAVNTLKAITSKMTLGFNTRAFTREMLVSMYTGAMRSHNYKIPGVTGEDFAWAIQFVLTHAPANIKKTELIGQLNQRFGMVGQSRSELAKSNFISDFGLRTIDMDNMTFMGTTLPDNWFRMAIVVARMHADGCFEAYELDENGILKYNPKKDKRFNKFLTDDATPIFKQWDASLGTHSEYLQAKAIWDMALNEWKLQPGKENILTLPEAYSPSVIRSLQHQAGELYGFFDEDEKSLMCSRFIGSAIMQYKTWLSAKIDQWLKRPGFSNIWQQVHKTNAEGKKLYILTHTSAEIANGLPPIEFITEDQLTDEMVKNGDVVPYIVQEGTYSEGMIQSTINFASTLLTMGPGEFLNMWKNDPVARGNFICGFIDMWGMLLFAGLVKLIFGEDLVNNKSAQPWFDQWVYGVLTGFAEDGPIHQVLGSMVGDWNPPSLTTIKQLARTTTSVLEGNKTLPQGFIESFGATKEFSGYFRQ